MEPCLFFDTVKVLLNLRRVWVHGLCIRSGYITVLLRYK